MTPIVKAYLMADEDNIINLTESDEKSLSADSNDAFVSSAQEYDVNNPTHALSQNHILKLLQNQIVNRPKQKQQRQLLIDHNTVKSTVAKLFKQRFVKSRQE